MTFKKYYLETSCMTMIYVNIKNLQDDAKENDDFKNANFFKIYEYLSNTRDVEI